MEEQERQLTPFEQERRRLIDEISQGLVLAAAKMQRLNENLERMEQEGKDVSAFAAIWKDFRSKMEAASSALPITPSTTAEEQYSSLQESFTEET
ncbi:hypothetical protein QOT17_024543 [Balamuthia mandrillaris]